MKTIQHLFTALLLLCCVGTATAHDFSVSGIYYSISSSTNKTVEVTYRGTSYNEYSNEYTGSVVIPQNVTYGGVTYSVTNIGDNAFYYCSGLTSVVIGNSVTSIGEDAFYGCTGLTSITIPNSVTSIGNNAFYYCTGLTSITIPNSVTSIGNMAFYGCSGLKTVINFSNLTFSKGSSGYGYVANYADKVYNAPNGFIDGDFIWIENESGMTLAYYLGDATELILPAEYNGKSVTSIGEYAFYGCSGLTSITIPNSVTNIGREAFYGCTGLTSVTIGNSVTSIGEDAFAYCSSLTSVVIPNSVTSIGEDAFYDCKGLKSVVIGNSVTSIGREAFYQCSGLTSIVIGNSVTSIGNVAFGFCIGLKIVINYSPFTFVKGANDYGYVAYYANKVINVSMGSVEDGYVFGELDGVNSLLLYVGNDSVLTLPSKYKGGDYVIGAEAFKNNVSITKVTIPNSVTNIENYAFEGCSALKELNIEDCENSLPMGNSVLYDCPLETLYLGRSLSYSTSPFYNMSTIKYITLSNGVTNIGDDVFSGCTGIEKLDLNCAEIGKWFGSVASLKEVVIGDKVTSIKESAFSECTGLEKVNVNNLAAWCNIDFADCYANPMYYAKSLYINNEKLTELIIPTSVPEVKKNAFYNGAEIISVTIPNSVISIGNDAFTGCNGIEKLDLNCTEIENWFSGVASLKEVVIGENVASIGDNAFKGCSNLAKLTIYENVGSVGCGVLDSTEWYDNQADGLLALDGWLLGYKGNEPIGDFVIAENIKGIANSAFENCTNLSSVEVPNNVVSIGDAAFAGCTGLTNVTVCDGVKKIGESSFEGCSNMEELYISNSIESIGYEAFAECNNILEIKIGSKKVITASENIFSTDVYNNAYLYVPDGRKDFYAKTSPWSNFIIREMDFTGIEELKSENGKVKTIYDLNGRAVENPSSGIYIINGKKVLVK